MFETGKQGSGQEGSGEGEKPVSTSLKVTGLLVIIVAAYVGYIFWSRAEEREAFAQRDAARKAAQAAADQKAVQSLGGDQFKILNFYAYPAAIARGDSTQLCYGVSNAASVTLEPQSNAVWPAFSKCVTVSPKKTTDYTFTATDAAGHRQQAHATVSVE
jgi:hypothetical protein